MGPETKHFPMNNMGMRYNKLTDWLRFGKKRKKPAKKDNYLFVTK
jgi:hypothetical protein